MAAGCRAPTPVYWRARLVVSWWGNLWDLLQPSTTR